MNVNIITALLQNELKDLRKNMTVLSIIFIPPLLALLMKRASGPPGAADILPIWLVYAQILVGMNLVALGLSEEKEKKTLEALRVSPASFPEILAAKLLFAVLICLAVQALTVAVIDGFVGNLPAVGLIAVLGSILFASIGLMIGILSPNQKSAGVVSTPVMLLFLLAPMLAATSKIMQKVGEYLPSVNAMNLLRSSLLDKEILGHNSPHAISLVCWTIAMVLLSLWVLKKKSAV